MKKDILSKVVKKLSKKPERGSFYIVGDALYYSTSRGGLGHPILWRRIVDTLFAKEDLTLRGKLYGMKFAADRGRVDWTGEIIEEEVIGDGQFMLEGTPTCAPFESKIKSVFGLTGKKVKIDWESNPVYFKDPQEVKELNKLLEEKNIVTKNTKVAKLIKLD